MKRSGNYRHGYNKTPIHRTWLSMKRRCDNPNAANYYLYGGRGIKYDPRWHKFENFLEDVGDKPDDTMSLDRIDNSGNYNKSNCRWATKLEQASNKRNNRWIEFKGEHRTMAEWARTVGIDTRTIFSRLNVYGWSVEDALTISPVIGRNQFFKAVDEPTVDIEDVPNFDV